MLSKCCQEVVPAWMDKETEVNTATTIAHRSLSDYYFRHYRVKDVIASKKLATMHDSTDTITNIIIAHLMLFCFRSSVFDGCTTKSMLEQKFSSINLGSSLFVVERVCCIVAIDT